MTQTFNTVLCYQGVTSQMDGMEVGSALVTGTKGS